MDLAYNLGDLYCVFTLSQLIWFVGNNSQVAVREIVLLLVVPLLLATTQSFPSRFVWGPRGAESLTDDPQPAISLASFHTNRSRD